LVLVQVTSYLYDMSLWILLVHYLYCIWEVCTANHTSAHGEDSSLLSTGFHASLSQCPPLPGTVRQRAGWGMPLRVYLDSRC
jgi:hypothetical protein